MQCALSYPTGAFILKPWSGSRSEGILIARDLGPVLALCSSAFGPRIASRYVPDPVLLDGRKFDIRMYVAVSSLSPFRAHVHSGWYARVANSPYASAPLCDTLAHLTVAKYEGFEQDFFPADHVVSALAADPRWGGWGAIKPKIAQALSRTFRLLAERAPNSAWGRGGSRALYGVDLMFAAAAPEAGSASPGRGAAAASGDGAAGDRGAQPVLLEVNYSPDLSSMLRFYPGFIDQVFAHLFDAGDGCASAVWEDISSHD